MEELEVLFCSKRGAIPTTIKEALITNVVIATYLYKEVISGRYACDRLYL